MQAKAFLLDSDTLIKWLFEPEILRRRLQPAIIHPTEMPVDAVRYAAFAAKPDAWQAARHYTEALWDSGNLQGARDFYETASGAIDVFFRETIILRYPSDPVCRRWIEIASLDAVHEHANREHIWMVVFAQELRDSRFGVTIVSEDPTVYYSFQRVGLLEDIDILPRNWRDS